MRDVIERIIDMWGDRYGKTFNTSNRRERLAELIKDLVYNDIESYQINGARRSVMRKMVGRRSPFGSKSLKEWNDDADSDFDAAMREAFVSVKVRTENIEIKPTGSYMSPEELVQKETSAKEDWDRWQKETEEAASREKIPESVRIAKEEHANEMLYQGEILNYGDIPPERPKIDPSIFKDVETTPIMSVEDFLATIERENNE